MLYMLADIISFFRTFDWLGILETYGRLHPLVPVLVVAAESFLPVLPLAGITAWNMAAYGLLAGGIYSWLGNCLGCTLVFAFFRLFRKKQGRSRKLREWVRGISPAALFMIIMMPFTPSVFVNFAFGISDYDPRVYLAVLYGGKVFLIFFLALFTHSLVLSLDQPLFLIPAVIIGAVLFCLTRIIHKRNRLDEAKKESEDK